MKNLKFILLPLAFFIVFNAYSQEGWILKETPYSYKAISGSAYLSFSFADKNNGWIGCSQYIIHTNDEGNTWNKQFGESNYSEGWRSIDFPDSLHGWCINNISNHLLYTNDGGKNWTEQSPMQQSELKKMQFVDSLHGWIIGANGGFTYTTDGGKNWIANWIHEGVLLKGIFFINQKIGWVVGNKGFIFHTSDGLSSWIRQDSLITNELLNSVYFIDTLNGWATGNNGIIIHSTDGGNIWYKQNSNIKSNINDICFPNSRTGWAVCDSGIILNTNDAGENWHIQFSSTQDELISLCFVDSLNGWIIGLFTLLHTTNGGISYIDNNNINNLTKINCFPNPFNDNITIEYNIETPGQVQLSIIDIFGREVGILFNDNQSSGKFILIFNGSTLKSGIYFIRLNTYNKIIFKKILLIK